MLISTESAVYAMRHATRYTYQTPSIVLYCFQRDLMKTYLSAYSLNIQEFKSRLVKFLVLSSQPYAAKLAVMEDAVNCHTAERHVQGWKWSNRLEADSYSIQSPVVNIPPHNRGQSQGQGSVTGSDPDTETTNSFSQKIVSPNAQRACVLNRMYEKQAALRHKDILFSPTAHIPPQYKEFCRAKAWWQDVTRILKLRSYFSCT